jgi:DNA-damage-inducible protein D
MEQIDKIIIFQEKQIRRTWHNEEWWYVVNDVVQTLTDSTDVVSYIKKLRSRDAELAKGWGQIVTPLAMETSGGVQKMNCANTEGVFRIIQSISSPKAEPFKRWLAQVGYERVKEIENPELAAERARELYKAKGYPDEWIDMRLKSIDVRQHLTDEWKGRGVQEGMEYAILTAEIARATFGVTPTEHKEIKGLVRENLRDHMTNLELIFTMLGEESTRQSAVLNDADGFDENKIAAKEGGEIAGKSREEFEKRLGKKVVSEDNFKLQIKESKKKIQKLPPSGGA